MVFRETFLRCFDHSDSESESDTSREDSESAKKRFWPRQRRSPVSSKDPKPFGLELVNPTATREGDYAQIQLDIIAVHGLGGHRINTWTEPDSNYFWLNDLSKKLGPINTRVFTFGYDATAAFGKSVAGIFDIANNLLQDLRLNRSNLGEKNRPLIFICHSLGGIVVKRALIMARMDAEFRELHDSVYGVAFMGTPHLGSNSADIASAISRIAQIALPGHKAHTQLVETLKTDSQFLLDVSRDFRHQELKKIVSFYEMEVTQPMNFLIVERNSAILNFPGESQIGCNANHRSICKFSSPSDERLKDVCGHLRIMAEAAINQSSHISVEGKHFLKKLSETHHLDPEKQLTEVLRKKSTNTAAWVQEDPTFVNWKNSPNHESLWLTGDPGSGKTVMSGSIIEKLHNDFKDAGSQKPLILHFFFDGKATDGKDHLNAMRGLLYQILTSRPFHAADVANRTRDGFPTSTLEKCTKIIHPLIRDIPKIFFILDAVDECEVLGLKLNKSERDKEKGTLLRQLFELKKHTPCFKFLVTSRTHPGFELAPVFEEYNPPNISLTCFQDYVKVDIARYISHELQDFKSIRSRGDNSREEHIKERIKTTILSQAGGMFLYASLAWTTFKDWDDEWNEIGVEARFDKLKALGAERVGTGTTETLYDLYLKILKMLSGNNQRLETNAKKLFKLLVTAHTPLTLEELRVAYALESEHDSKASMEKSISMGDFRDVLKKNCGALIKIMEASQTVYLVHQSIKEFFLEANDHPFSFSRTSAELDISSACLTYLSFKDLSNTSLGEKSGTGMHEHDFRLIKEYPFLKYAVLHWYHHAAQVQDNPSLWNHFVSWTSSNNLNLCIRILWYFKGRDDPPQNATPMHVLCYLGLEKLVGKALSPQTGNVGGETHLEWAVMSDRDTAGRTPLHWAAVNGHDKVVKLLLEEKTDPHPRDNYNFTPMDLAIDFGNIGVATLLMGDRRCDEHSGSWMEMAATSGHKEMIKFLLKRGADVNTLSPNSEYGSALHAAAYEGHLEVVELILANHADSNSYSPKHGTPLQAAVYHGHRDIVELLVDHGANVNGKAGIHGTALQIAARKGYGDIVKILIERGADVNAKGDRLGSALYAAEHAGHTGVQVILKSSGARSIRPTFERRQSKLDDSFEHALALVGREVKKGRQSGVEKKVEEIKADMMEAVLSRNKKKLDWYLGIGARSLKLAVRFGRESILELAANVGMAVLQEAVARNYSEGVEMILRGGVKVLLAVINEGKAPLVRILLQGCTKSLKTLFDDERYIDTKNQLHVVVTAYIKVCETGNRELIEMSAENGVEVLESLMKKVFEKYLVEVVDTYTNRWIQAIQRRDEKVVLSIGRAGIEFLLAGVRDQKQEVVEYFTPIFIANTHKVLDSGQSDNIEWLLGKGRPAFKTIVQGKDEELVTNIVKVGMELLLAIVRHTPEQNHSRVRSVILGPSTEFLKEIERVGLLGKLEDTVKKIAHEKLKGCGDKKQLWKLEEQFSEFLSAISEASEADLRISTTMSSIRNAIKILAIDVAKRIE